MTVRRDGHEGAGSPMRFGPLRARPLTHHTNRETDTHMTQPDHTQDDEFFDSATSEFPAKEDLKDRLVAIWNTGKTGERKNDRGEMYPYVETVTLVLDDGPDGWSAKRFDGDPNLVPSVAENGPQRLDGFQWSTKGVYSRTTNRRVGDRPMIGRINSMKNKSKGMNDAWSIAEMTEDDRVVARQFTDQFRAITQEMQAAADNEAFTS